MAGCLLKQKQMESGELQHLTGKSGHRQIYGIYQTTLYPISFSKGIDDLFPQCRKEEGMPHEVWTFSVDENQFCPQFCKRSDPGTGSNIHKRLFTSTIW